MKGILYYVTTSNNKSIIVTIIFLMSFVRSYVMRTQIDLPMFGLSSAILASTALASTIPAFKEERTLEYIFAYSKRGFKRTMISLALSYALIALTLSALPFYDRPRLAAYAILSAASLSITLTVLELILPTVISRAVNFILIVGVFSLVSLTNLDLWVLPLLLMGTAILSMMLPLLFEDKIRDRVVNPT